MPTYIKLKLDKVLVIDMPKECSIPYIDRITYPMYFISSFPEARNLRYFCCFKLEYECVSIYFDRNFNRMTYTSDLKFCIHNEYTINRSITK